MQKPKAGYRGKRAPIQASGGQTKRARRMRFSVRWAAAAVIVGAVVAALAAIERRDHLRNEVAFARAETAYRNAKLARVLAEVAVKDYAEGTFRRELATAEAEIKQAEDELSGVATDSTGVFEWEERIRSKLASSAR